MIVFANIVAITIFTIIIAIIATIGAVIIAAGTLISAILMSIQISHSGPQKIAVITPFRQL